MMYSQECNRRSEVGLGSGLVTQLSLLLLLSLEHFFIFNAILIIIIIDIW